MTRGAKAFLVLILSLQLNLGNFSAKFINEKHLKLQADSRQVKPPIVRLLKLLQLMQVHGPATPPITRNGIKPMLQLVNGSIFSKEKTASLAIYKSWLS